ncbi:MAG: CheR family methyltransferase [Vulcanimicrobiota bacterium]
MKRARDGNDTSTGEKATGEKSSRPPKELLPEEPVKQLPVVAIGASAGGLKALELFFAHVPHNIGMAFVVIQHLSTTHKSIMGELLKRHTNLDIVEVTDGLKLRRNTVYLNLPDKDMAIFNGVFHLLDPVTPREQRFPIDSFFRSLAEDLADHAICVILSGSGTDGTLGLEAVKEAGGMTMVQDEQQAEYSSMPQSAIKTGLVDIVLPAEAMPGEIINYVKHPYMEGSSKGTVYSKHFETYVHKILLLLRSTQRHDFTHYKQSTIQRRIERRMAVYKIENIAVYCRYLQENPQEGQVLFKELLISVTSFFRDSAAFNVLESSVVPEILKKKQSDMPVRIWVPGCATGEEAFSIAMLFVEAMNRMEKHLNLQVFATDIDGSAIDRARQGEFPESIASDVSAERLKRFFMKEGDIYKIKKEIREMIIFSLQNVVADPPFSRLDLISCRNVLIYMDGELQKKLMPLFHYALSDDGYLFLGNSETIGQFADLFKVVDSKAKVFRRKPVMAVKGFDYPPLRFPTRMEPGHTAVMGEGQKKEQNRREIMEHIVLEHYSAPSVLVNEKYEALYFHGSTERYLVLPKGEASLNVLSICRGGLRSKLNALLLRAEKENKIAVSPGVKLTQGKNHMVVDISVCPVDMSGKKLFVIAFEERKSVTEPEKAEGKTGGGDDRVTTLEQDLQATRDHLQTTIEELETSNEELKSANEELQSTNEELQSTNEEVETAKEELQSTNEELVTVNSELIAKVDELTQANNDINNLLASTDIGTIFLDTCLGIKRFTPAMTRLFNLISTDVGRSLRDITTKIMYSSLYEQAEEVLNTLQSQEFEVHTKDGKYYLMRIHPYRTRENVIDGVVITFVDITDITTLGQELKRAREELRIMNMIANAFLLASDKDVYVQVLDIILRHMESPLGIFGLMGEEGEIVIPCVRGDIWDRRHARESASVIPSGSWGGTWESATREKKSIRVHDTLHMPEGHSHVTCAVVTPIIHQDTVLGLLEVAEKPGDYSTGDVVFIESLACYIAPFVHARLSREKVNERS